MTMSWSDASEIVVGLILEKRIGINAVRPDLFMPPYSDIIKLVKQGDIQIEDIIEQVGLTPVQASLDSVKNINGLGDAKWVAILEKSALAYEAGGKLERYGRRLQQGNEIDWGIVSSLAHRAMEGVGGDFSPLSAIEPGEIPFKTTGFRALDEHLGGLPEVGQVIVAAPPGCLVGDTIVGCNRARKGFSIALRDLYKMSHDGKRGGKTWNKSIDTYLQSRRDDGTIRLNKMREIYESGEKDVYELRLTNGMTLVGTVDHPILTRNGWIELGKLTVKDEVYVNIGQGKDGKNKPWYLVKEGLKFHPYCGRKNQNRFTVSTHRLVMEVHLNGISLDEFVEICRTGIGIEKIHTFLPLNISVHHIDMNVANNSIDNLKMIERVEHLRLHSINSFKNVLYHTGLVNVQSVIYVGKAMTYDVYMENEPHNFIANGMVVHNTGKTTFMIGLTGCYARTHPNENVAIFTLEMMKREISLRFEEVVSLTKEARDRIQINDAILTPEEVISKAAQIDDLGLVCIDFADLLIKGETTESAMAHIYRTFMLGAKQLECPIVLLSQLNRGYTGGIPRPNDIRYTGLAEALGWMIIMLYNPASDYFAEEECEDVLPIVENTAYIVCWKVRGGFRRHKDDSPGAIQLQFKGEKGWRLDSAGKWFSLKKL